MSKFIAFFFGAVAVLCAAAFVSTAFRVRVLRHLPLHRRTYALAAVWFALAVVIVSSEGRMPYERLQRLRIIGAALSVLAISSMAWDYRRHRLTRTDETRAA
jgi:hypothetical protein